jgi:hypothetical protein
MGKVVPSFDDYPSNLNQIVTGDIYKEPKKALVSEREKKRKNT